MRRKERTQRILADMQNAATRSGQMEKRTDPAQIPKSLRTKAFLSVKFFLFLFFFLEATFFFFLVFSFWYLEILVFSSLSGVCVSSGFFLPPLPPLPRSVRGDPCELVRQVSPFPSSLPSICHTVCFSFFSSLPHPQRVHGLSGPRAELSYSCTPPLQLRIIIWFHIPSPSVLKFSPSSSSSSLFLPPSVVAAAAPPRASVCIFGFRRLQRGASRGLRRGTERRRQSRRRIGRRDGFG